jgi:hypothetical protein
LSRLTIGLTIESSIHPAAMVDCQVTDALPLIARKIEENRR